MAEKKEYGIGFEMNTITPSASPNADWTISNKATITLDQVSTFTFTDPPGATTVQLIVVQGGTGSYTINWPASVKWSDGGTAPTLSTAVGAIDVVSFLFDGTNYLGVGSVNFT
jgi:hypothetical protein